MNTTAVAPVRTTKAPARTKQAPAPVVAPAHAEPSSKPAWFASTIALFEKLETLAEAAHQVDGAHGRGDVYASRIDGIAAHELARAIEAMVTDKPGKFTLSDAQDVAFQVHALIHGAELAGPTRIMERTAIHDGMLALIDNFISAESDLREPFTPQPMRAEPVEECAGNLNKKQLNVVLEVVTGYALTLNRLLMGAQQTSDIQELAETLDAAVIITSTIGAIADSSSGAGIYGDHDYWHFGPNFATQGKAGAA